MAEFKIKIAGAVASVTSLFDSTRDYCRNYLTEEPADFSIVTTREDLAFEQEQLRQEALAEGIRIRVFTDPFLERTAIQRKMADYLIDRDVLMVHGSAVAVDGEAYLFTARCGTGKSTHTRYWREIFGDRTLMVNDDKPFLKITETGVLACGAPWSGKHGLDSNVTLPLKGICVLQRGSQNRICRAEPEAVAEMLRQQSHRPLDPEKHGQFRKLTAALTEKCLLWQMQCSKDPQAALVSYGAMSGKKEN